MPGIYRFEVRFFMMCIRRLAAIFLLVCAGGLMAGESTARETLEQARAAPSPAESIRILESALPSGGEWRFFYLMEITLQYSRLGDWTAARSVLSRIDTAEVPKNHIDRYTYWLALTREQTGDREEAEKLYGERVLSAKAGDPLLYLGYLRIASSGAQKILTAMDTALPDLRRTDPASWILSRYLGALVAVREGEWAFASQCLSVFLSDRGNAPEEYRGWASFYYGWSLYRLGEWEKAHNALLSFLELHDDHERVWQAATAAAFCALQTGRDPLPLADRAIAHAPTQTDRAEGLVFKASILTDRGDHAAASGILQSVADGTATSGQTAESPRARFMLADIAFVRRQYAEAEKHWLMVYGDFPESPLAEESLFRAAEQWYLQGTADRAVRLFTRYRQNHPNGKYTDLVLKNGGEALFSAGKTDLAILWWEAFVTRFPKSTLMPRVLYDLVSAYRASGDYGAALRMARSYRHDYPDEAEADRMAEEIEALELLNRGAPQDAASLAVEYRRLGGAGSPGGRSKGLALARMYLADRSRREDGVGVLGEIVAALPADTARIGRTDRAVFAGAEMLLGNYLRDTGDYPGSARAFLSAGNLYAPIDGERAAESLYGAVDAFLRTNRRGDAEKALETMRTSWPRSVWTGRARRLLPAE